MAPVARAMTGTIRTSLGNNSMSRFSPLPWESLTTHPRCSTCSLRGAHRGEELRPS